MFVSLIYVLITTIYAGIRTPDKVCTPLKPTFKS